MNFDVKEVNELARAVKEAFDQAGTKLSAVQDELRDSTKEGRALKEAVTALQDNYTKARAEVDRLGNAIEAKTADLIKDWTAKANEAQAKLQEHAAEILELKQQRGRSGVGGGEEQKSIFDIVTASEEYKAARRASNPTKMDPVTIGSFHKTQIVNATMNTSQPLVAGQRVPGIIFPAEQRLFIRDVIPSAMTDSNVISFCTEASYTSNARPQGDASPVGQGEGENKAESAMTFTLNTVAVTTIAHWIPASRQVLSDAPLLQGHLGGRLVYGLKLEEESEMLTGTGGANTINGINNQAAAFAFGDTNQTALDTLLEALLQVTLSNYEASAFVLHPVDWWNVMKLKDTQNRYLFVDPANMATPRIWGKPVVASQSQTQGQFTAGAFNMGAQIWDREDATVRISEHHANFFVQNMVAILAEERVAMTVYRTTAFVYGAISHAG